MVAHWSLQLQERKENFSHSLFSSCTYRQMSASATSNFKDPHLTPFLFISLCTSNFMENFPSFQAATVSVQGLFCCCCILKNSSQIVNSRQIPWNYPNQQLTDSTDRYYIFFLCAVELEKLLKTHRWVALKHWVKCSSITMNTHTP